LLKPEGDVAALAAAIRRVRAEPGLRAALGAKGRARVLALFTHAEVAAATVAVYREML
ncbi:MAG: glycosyltransferase family 1 protein, partial [Anaerolinea sp.]|nr:glycosyltransferase family 1 protein [Anaerolinea sp.]